MAPRSPFAEAFRELALRLRELRAHEGGSSVLVTSGLPGEGKTLTACNLALALASFGTAELVALVDLDLRMPGVGRALGLEPGAGVEAVLRGERPLEEVATVTDAGIHVYAAAAPQPAAHELLARPELGDALKRLEATYRWVICDSPPLLLVPDVQLLVPHVGACIAVVRAGKTPRELLGEVVERLPQEKLLGFFLNDGRRPAHARRHFRSAYYGSEEADSDREAKR